MNRLQLEAKDLIKLNFHKNASGDYHCPITFKVFNANTHIVAIKPSGNVYSYEAVERLNIKTRHWQDLMNDEPFKKKDIITIQDPHNIAARNITDFYYVKNELKVVDEEAAKKEKEVGFKINAMGSTDKVLRKVLGTKDDGSSSESGDGKSIAKAKTPVQLTPSFVTKDKKAYNSAHYSTGMAAASFTSTALSVQTKNESATIDDEKYMFERVKEKGYAQIQTNLGNINLELYCGDAPRTCYNFIQLAKKGMHHLTLESHVVPALE